MNLIWGVQGFYYDKFISTDHTIEDLQAKLKTSGHIKEGEFVINIASMPIDDRGKTNMVKLSVV